MGIKFKCPHCHKKLNVKSFLAGKRGVCPHCQAGIDIPEAKGDKKGESDKTKSTAAAPGSTPAPGAGPAPVVTKGEDSRNKPASKSGDADGSAPASVQPTPVVAVSPTQPTPTLPKSGTVPVPAVVPVAAGKGTTSVPVGVVAPGQVAPVVPVGVVATAQGTPVVPVGVVATGQGAPAVPVGVVASPHPVTGAPGVPAAVSPVVPVGAVPSPLPVGAAAPTVPVGVVAPIPHPAPVVTTPVVTMPDPFVEAPHAVWYVRPPSGGQYGPAKSESMRRWIDEGRVTADSLVWREGWADWRLASATFPRFAAVPAPAPYAGPTPGLPPSMPVAAFGGVAVPMSAPTQGVIPAINLDAGPSSATGKAAHYRKRSSAAPLVLVIFLVIALIVLVPVLIFVLKGGFR